MQRVILKLIITAVCTLNLSAQVSSNEQLLRLEKEIFFSKNDTLRNTLLLNKSEIYFGNQIISAEAVAEVKRVKKVLIENQVSKINFLFNASLLFFVTNDFNNAKTYFLDYLEEKKDTSAQDLLLGALIYNQYDTSLVSYFIRRAALKDSSVLCLECLNQVFRYETKRKKMFLTMSYLIPGSGTIASGFVGRGLTSLAITGGLATGIYFLIANKLYFNAAFTVFPWFAKFYGGQARLTKKMIERKELKRKNKMAGSCSEKLSALIQKYPLQFKMRNE